MKNIEKWQGTECKKKNDHLKIARRFRYERFVLVFCAFAFGTKEIGILCVARNAAHIYRKAGNECCADDVFLSIQTHIRVRAQRKTHNKLSDHLSFFNRSKTKRKKKQKSKSPKFSFGVHWCDVCCCCCC